MDRSDDQEEARPRPRVVDKRVSTRPDAAASAPDSTAAPATEGSEAPVPESNGPAAAEPAASEGPAPGSEPAPGPEEHLWTPEQEAEARRFVEEVTQTPSVEWVVNAAVTLANVAATKLDAGMASDAQLAIDALAAMVTAVGSRLGDAEAPLRQTLAQLQLAFAQGTAPPPATP